jgi:hypothetical protein
MYSDIDMIYDSGDFKALGDDEKVMHIRARLKLWEDEWSLKKITIVLAACVFSNIARDGTCNCSELGKICVDCGYLQKLYDRIVEMEY